IGGIIIGIDDKRYDASVKTQLSVFKDKLINNK
ncbi:MAG: F0F1 ATP synthase subunit delta, partial [Bacteroidales bacterium]|nr:F0F1 ATP synthase subunit delta [Bacteroidales bacterium]